MSNYKKLQEVVHDALQRVLYDFAEDDTDKGVLTSFSVSMEVAGADGEMWLKHIASDGCTAWKELGMLISAEDDIRDRMRQKTEYQD